jgi:hypothetical protein
LPRGHAGSRRRSRRPRAQLRAPEPRHPRHYRG